VRDAISNGTDVTVQNMTKGESYPTKHAMSDRQIESVLEGSLLTLFKNRSSGTD